MFVTVILFGFGQFLLFHSDRNISHQHCFSNYWYDKFFNSAFWRCNVINTCVRAVRVVLAFHSRGSFFLLSAFSSTMEWRLNTSICFWCFHICCFFIVFLFELSLVSLWSDKRLTLKDFTKFFPIFLDMGFTFNWKHEFLVSDQNLKKIGDCSNLEMIWKRSIISFERRTSLVR